MAVLVTDTFTGDDDDPWDPAVWPLMHAPGDPCPEPTIQGNRGRMLTLNTPQSNIIAYTDPVLTDTEITVKYQPDPLNNAMFLEIGYRITANIGTGNPGNGYMVFVHPQGNTVRLDRGNDTNDRVYLAQDVFTGLSDFDEHWFRVKVRGSRHQVKWWDASGAEPPGWRIDLVDATYTAAGRSYLRLFNDFSDTNYMMVDNFRLEEVVPAPDGFRVGTDRDLVEALYVGDEPVVAAYLGDVEIPVPPYV